MVNLPCPVTLSWPEMEHAWDVGLRRLARGIREGAQPRYGAPNELAPRMAINVASCPPEYAVAKLTGEFWHGPEPFDPTAPDVGADIQVRHTDLRHGCLLTHPEDKDHERFYLVTDTDDPTTFLVVGWLWGGEAKQQHWWRTNIRHPAFLTPQNMLRKSDG